MRLVLWPRVEYRYSHGVKMAKTSKNDKKSHGYIDKEPTPCTIEEVMNRSHRDITVDDDEPLQKKTTQKDILLRLLKIEQEIFKKAYKKGII